MNQPPHLARLDKEAVVDRLMEENEKLKQIIAEYSRHNPGCSAQFGKKYRCKCGWDKVKKGIDGKESNKL